MKCAQAYLAKTLPVVPPVLDEIEEPQSAGTASTDAVAGFLGRYLACEPHQLTVLALWVIYTWCFEHISTAVYLASLERFSPGLTVQRATEFRSATPSAADFPAIGVAYRGCAD
jgi:hypothetical protein